MLRDNYGRPIQYLRLAVTDRCNLRCHYCMPEHGLDWLSRSALLTYEEMLRLCRLLTGMGIEKIRITGGEPFVRKDLIYLLESLSALEGLQQISITTNGVATAPFVPRLKALGIRSVNLSLDTLNRERFFAITRRDELPAVLQTLEMLLRHDFQVKINAVVMPGQNDQDLIGLAHLTEKWPVDVRFIEEMPFNGSGAPAVPGWDHVRILEQLRRRWPDLAKADDPPASTAMHYQAPGHLGKIGIIAAWTRSFCGTCNRIRITPQGVLKTCLYEGGGLQLRDLLRAGAGEAEISRQITDALLRRHKDGWEAARESRSNGVLESMATIGG